MGYFIVCSHSAPISLSDRLKTYAVAALSA
ncbi:hypothetical protein HDF11_000576 [Tunturiibacter psychrotolerans]